MELSFLFALCAPGAERSLKEEVERRRLPWSPAYQRPGFVTFKGEGESLPDLVFAREASWSCGRGLVVPPGTELVRVSPCTPEHRDAAQALARALGAPARSPRVGERVAEVVLVGPDETWIGTHVHGAAHSIHPGGWWPEEIPPEAPSRAFAKLEAVLAWFGLVPNAGEHAVELGSSPGGASWSLLLRGLEVTGVDPAEMDPRVLAHPAFHHLPVSATALSIDALPPRVEWLLADMNVAPRLTLRTARTIAAAHAPRAIVLTMKLKQWELARALPDWIAEVRGWGYREVHAKQLSPHRQELALVAWR